MEAASAPAAASTGTANTKALLVHHSFTGQAIKMSDAMAEELRARGFDVTQAGIELTDKRWHKHFTQFPMPHAFWNIFRMMPAQTLRRTGEIVIPPEAQSGDYGLVVVFSPTWWLTTNMATRSFLKAPTTAALLAKATFTDVVVCRRYWRNNHKTVRKLSKKLGATYLEGIHFAYKGGQVRSMLSLISYMTYAEYRPKFLGVKIPVTNLSDGQVEEGRAFARQLAEKTLAAAPATPAG